MFKCSNVVKKVTELQEDVRQWITCPNYFYVGIHPLVAGKEDTERKFLCTVTLTTA